MLSDNLKALREQKGWSRRVLCEMIEEFRSKKHGYSEIKAGMYQKYEEGTNEPDISKLCLLADFYSLTLDELIRGDIAERWNEQLELKELERLKKKYEGKKRKK